MSNSFNDGELSPTQYDGPTQSQFKATLLNPRGLSVPSSQRSVSPSLPRSLDNQDHNAENYEKEGSQAVEGEMGDQVEAFDPCNALAPADIQTVSASTAAFIGYALSHIALRMSSSHLKRPPLRPRSSTLVSCKASSLYAPSPIHKSLPTNTGTEMHEEMSALFHRFDAWSHVSVPCSVV